MYNYATRLYQGVSTEIMEKKFPHNSSMVFLESRHLVIYSININIKLLNFFIFL